MDGLWLSIVSLVVGMIASYLVSYYFFKKSSKNKSLTPFLQFSSSPLDGLDQDLKEDLKIKYKQKEVEDLFEVQFLIANTGEKAISNLIEPLTLVLPNDCELLDANILYKNPDGRKVLISLQNQRQLIEYNFPLLNAGEFFITKLLINGSPLLSDLKFTIEGEELPPELDIKELPPEALISQKSEKRVKFKLEMFLIGISLTYFGLILINLLYGNLDRLPSLNKLGFIKFMFNLSFIDVVILMSIFPIISCLVLGVLLILSSIFNNFKIHFKKKKNTFIVPDNKNLRRIGNFYYTDY
ncbi:hypothetical protein ACFQ4X_14290 [Fictibacillus halophilus]|uniref:hypothetical protein n=1 Tax=Fictibacillus halophilus TaxID=1610490 RepID=UPI003630C0C7